MGTLTRQFPLPHVDLLEGCKTLVGREVPLGESIDGFMPLLDLSLNEFFFHIRTDLTQIVQTQYGTSATTADEVSSFLQNQLHLRIQRTFGVIYPSRQYDYSFCKQSGTIIVREFEPDTQPAVERYSTDDLPVDDEDAWIPERQRR